MREAVVSASKFSGGGRAFDDADGLGTAPSEGVKSRGVAFRGAKEGAADELLD